jgi:NAD(P)-dependent dehydrogenase (short-subunit alcohol dehydrogenase family)
MAVMVRSALLEDLPVEALRAQFDANFFGWHDLTRRVVPVMRAQGRGRIVQCSSILGLVPMRFRGAYNASKHALEGLSVTLAIELEGSNIHVSLIEPGAIASRFRANALRHFHRHIDISRSVYKRITRPSFAVSNSRNALTTENCGLMLSTRFCNTRSTHPARAIITP